MPSCMQPCTQHWPSTDGFARSATNASTSPADAHIRGMHTPTMSIPQCRTVENHGPPVTHGK
jgi:hypothetical protein